MVTEVVKKFSIFYGDQGFSTINSIVLLDVNAI
jgi:hypothetical protein